MHGYIYFVESYCWGLLPGLFIFNVLSNTTFVLPTYQALACSPITVFDVLLESWYVLSFYICSNPHTTKHPWQVVDMCVLLRIFCYVLGTLPLPTGKLSAGECQQSSLWIGLCEHTIWFPLHDHTSKSTTRGFWPQKPAIWLQVLSSRIPPIHAQVCACPIAIPH